MDKLDYWQKLDPTKAKDLEWNFPEQKSNSIAVVGGNAGSFANVVKTAEYLSEAYPLKSVPLCLPDALKTTLPNSLPDLNFYKSTSAGSFAKSRELNEKFAAADAVLLAGDLSKNAETAIAITDAIKATREAETLVLAKDSLDLVAPEMSSLIEDHKTVLLASMPQLQKLFRALLYPKMVLLSQPLLPTVETLHKFTLSYENTTVITFHAGQIVLANQGKILTFPLEKTKYTPLTFFTGLLPADLAAYNLWNPSAPLLASASALVKTS